MEEILVGLVIVLMVALAIRMFIVMVDGAKTTLEYADTVEASPKMDYRYEEFLEARNQIVKEPEMPLTVVEESVDAEPTMAIHAVSEEDVLRAAKVMLKDFAEYPTYELKAELLPIRKRKKKASKKKKSTKKKTKTRGKK